MGYDGKFRFAIKVLVSLNLMHECARTSSTRSAVNLHMHLFCMYF